MPCQCHNLGTSGYLPQIHLLSLWILLQWHRYYTPETCTYINSHVSNEGNENRRYRGTQHSHTSQHILIQNLLLQAWTPSDQVCSNFSSLASPHFRNQAPPRPQQLNLPGIFVVPHFGHAGLTALGLDMVVRRNTDVGTASK